MAITLSGERNVNLGFLTESLTLDLYSGTDSGVSFRKLLKLADDEQFDQVLENTNFSNCQRILNLRAVVMLRSGRPAEAVNILRRLAISSTSLVFKPNVPLHIKANLATALFMAGNVAGTLDLIRQLPADSEPQLILLRADIEAWERSLSRMRWLDWKLCRIQHIKEYLPVSFVPGEIGLPHSTAA